MKEFQYELNVCDSFLKSTANKMTIMQRDWNNRQKNEEELTKAGRFLNVRNNSLFISQKRENSFHNSFNSLSKHLTDNSQRLESSQMKTLLKSNQLL